MEMTLEAKWHELVFIKILYFENDLKMFGSVIGDRWGNGVEEIESHFKWKSTSVCYLLTIFDEKLTFEWDFIDNLTIQPF